MGTPMAEFVAMLGFFTTLAWVFGLAALEALCPPGPRYRPMRKK